MVVLPFLNPPSVNSPETPPDRTLRSKPSSRNSAGMSTSRRGGGAGGGRGGRFKGMVVSPLTEKIRLPLATLGVVSIEACFLVLNAPC